MLVTAAGVADTLRLLVPGFVALEVFYVFGLKTKRTDAQWFVFSILMSVVIARLVEVVGLPVRLLTTLPLAVAGGLFAAGGWRSSVGRFPFLRPLVSERVWDSQLGRGKRWVQVDLTSGVSYSGYVAEMGLSAEVDDPDLYLVHVSLIDADAYVELDGLDGMILPRSAISSISLIEARQEWPTP